MKRRTQGVAKGGEVYLRYTPDKGQSFIRWHQCWDADLFISTVTEAQAKEGCVVEEVTSLDYRQERWRKPEGIRGARR